MLAHTHVPVSLFLLESRFFIVTESKLDPVAFSSPLALFYFSSTPFHPKAVSCRSKPIYFTANHILLFISPISPFILLYTFDQCLCYSYGAVSCLSPPLCLHRPPSYRTHINTSCWPELGIWI